jgi:hypothetical protein
MKNRYSIERLLEILNRVESKLKYISDMDVDGCYPTALGKCQGLAFVTASDLEIARKIIESELEEDL